MRAERDEVSFIRIPAAYKKQCQKSTGCKESIENKTLDILDESIIFIKNAVLCSNHCLIGMTPQNHV